MAKPKAARRGAKLRTQAEDGVQIAHHEKRVGKDGVAQPATPKLTGDVLRKALETAAALEEPARQARRRAENKPVPRQVTDHEQWRLYMLADEIDAFRGIVKLHLDYDSEADYEALALITHAIATRMHEQVRNIANALDRKSVDAAKAAYGD